MDDAGKLLAEAIRWVEDYLSSIRTHPVLSRVRPGEIKQSLTKHPPDDPEPMENIFEDVDRIIVPGLTHWNHPRFFGYFAITGSVPGIAAELMSAAMNVNAMLWRTSPAATELEEIATGWLTEMLRLPPWFGTINDTASTSTLYALAAARHRIDPEIRSRGLAGKAPLVFYCSDQAHSSVDKAVLTIGVGTDYLRRIPTDRDFRMEVNDLRQAIGDDLRNGLKPAGVIATVGTTATTSVDPIDAIGDICAEYGIWLHVDAAYAGVAAVLEDYRWIFQGMEKADTVVVNPHKWLFVPIDCSVLFMKDPNAMRDAFSVVPEYLATSDREARNLMDYGISLGRRFRALKLWMVIRSMGVSGIRTAIAEHIRLAAVLADLIAEHKDFEILGPHQFSVVNFRYMPSGKSIAELDELNQRIVDELNAAGEFFVTTARIGKALAVHAAIGNLGTTEEDVRGLWRAIQKAAEL